MEESITRWQQNFMWSDKGENAELSYTYIKKLHHHQHDRTKHGHVSSSTILSHSPIFQVLHSFYSFFYTFPSCCISSCSPRGNECWSMWKILCLSVDFSTWNSNTHTHTHVSKPPVIKWSEWRRPKKRNQSCMKKCYRYENDRGRSLLFFQNNI